MSLAASASVDISIDSESAFDLFTNDIDRWWRRDPMNWNDPDRAVGVRFEPGVNGRWIEVHDAATGEGFEMGKIIAWDQGKRIVFTYFDAGHEIDGTEVEIRFEAIDGGTRVSVEHRGWERVAEEIRVKKLTTKRWGWANILNWYADEGFKVTFGPLVAAEYQ